MLGFINSISPGKVSTTTQVYVDDANNVFVVVSHVGFFLSFFELEDFLIEILNKVIMSNDRLRVNYLVNITN